LTELNGQIERITFRSEESGYTIARIKVRGRHDLVTVVGNLMNPAPGEILKMKGTWTCHPKYGEQFKLEQYETVVPATVHGIRKYLGSGLIRGIGPVMADRIVKKFGLNTLDVIENNIDRLIEVEGIGGKRISMIKKAWDEQKEIRQVMLFLQSHGVSSGYAAKIFKYYGNRAISIVRENPYRLATDIFGIGFITADRIAENLGFEKDSLQRVTAGCLFVLNQLADEGHVYYPYQPLTNKCGEILEVDREIVTHGLAALSMDRKIIIEDMNDVVENFVENNKAVYLSTLYVCETRIAFRMNQLIQYFPSIRNIDAEKAIDWVQKALNIHLAQKQENAIRCAIESKVMIITGGPGTGKTTIINAILRIFKTAGVRTLLAAPTGRAAKRMSETTGHPAKTIHRLLEFSFQEGGFQKNEKKPLKCDLLIVDEASMIDTVLMHHLLKAVPLTATLILIGDVNQLPSVGPGSVLRDIMESEAVPVVALTEIFRQARQSRIIVNAHRINQGMFPLLPSIDASQPVSDFYFIEQEDPERVVQIIVELTKERIPKRFRLDPIDDIQVLTPMNKGIVGAGNLNRHLQEVLNPGEARLVRGASTYKVNDKVMQIRNNYDKKVYNGDMGRIGSIDSETQEVTIFFEERPVAFDVSELDEVVPAYAVSVHKSQGAEYPAIVMPILTQHYMMLQRNLLYTAVTRAKNLVVIVGTRKALAIAIKNDKTRKRYTLLKKRLKGINNVNIHQCTGE
jgi:exodeoxyribonuclease V alpha subunit